MKPNSPSPSAAGLKTPTHDQISQRAEELWRQQGRPADRDDAIWLEAERQLLNESRTAFAARPAGPARRPAARNASVPASAQ